MAGEWIKVRNDLHTHPKVVRMSSALNADRLRIVGGLHAVWCLFDVHSNDGSLSGYSAQVVDSLIGFDGFSAAMSAVKWLNIDENGLSLPEFDEHNGQSAKRRATETKRKRLERDQELELGKENVQRKVSASDADKKRSREEKRREEVNTDKPPSVVSRATRKAPIGFEVTEDMREWAALQCPTVVAELATAKFRDHTFKTAISDWAGAWRNWLRKDAEFAGKQGAEPGWRRDARERMQRVVPMIAEKTTNLIAIPAHEFFEIEAKNVTAKFLGR